MRLRQIALAARDLDAATDDLCAVLGIEIAFRDPGVKVFGLRNAVMPVGDTFLEVVSPIDPGASAARWLSRRGGDGGYMAILQTPDLAAERRRLERLGVRVVWEASLEDIAAIHLHPRDVGAAIVSFDEPRPPESWRWAGPWRGHVRNDRVGVLRGAVLQAADPDALAARWGEVLGLPVSPGRLPEEAGPHRTRRRNAALRAGRRRSWRGTRCNRDRGRGCRALPGRRPRARSRNGSGRRRPDLRHPHRPRLEHPAPLSGPRLWPL